MKIDLDQAGIYPIHSSVFAKKGLNVSVLRLDRLHPVVSGNKWFKLRYYLDQASREGSDIITFGGAWSNHLIATAFACRELNIACSGIVRGEKPANLSPTLEAAAEYGMKLFYCNRQAYAEKQIPESIPLENAMIIPEGGYGSLGASGFATVGERWPLQEFDHICCAVGTGTMLAGLAQTVSAKLTGISVMNNNFSLKAAINAILDKPAAFSIHHDFHFGGYAKVNQDLINFMNRWFEETGIPSDFVYTGKLFYAIETLATQDYFPTGSSVLLIHSGGLQGNQSLATGKLKF